MQILILVGKKTGDFYIHLLGRLEGQDNIRSQAFFIFYPEAIFKIPRPPNLVKFIDPVLVQINVDLFPAGTINAVAPAIAFGIRQTCKKTHLVLNQNVTPKTRKIRIDAIGQILMG